MAFFSGCRLNYFVLFVALVHVHAYEILLEKCEDDTGNYLIRNETLQLTPYPMKVPGVQYLKASGFVKDYPSSYRLADSMIHMRMSKETFFGDLSIPCILGFGSCTKTLQEFAPVLAAKFEQGVGQADMEFVDMCIPDPTGSLRLGRLLFQGEYHVKVEAFDKDNQEKLFCIQFTMEVESGNESCTAN